jgi:predicted metal-dependent HD superfamily phosphohydrolase
MFKIIFKTELASLDADKVLAEAMWTEIDSAYNNQDRSYHNLSHLDSLIRELTVVKKYIDDWQTLVFSVAYHDIIYDVLRTDNEEASAEVATLRLKLLKLPQDKVNKCGDQILATKHHSLSTESDTNFLTDADLAILGSDNDSYKTYTKKIRSEYKTYPDAAYNAGRKKVLDDFLHMDYIYKTEYFSEKYEQQARVNISRELAGFN